MYRENCAQLLNSAELWKIDPKFVAERDKVQQEFYNKKQLLYSQDNNFLHLGLIFQTNLLVLMG